MTSSPGTVVASTACMNAMFAPAVTMMRLPRVDVDAVFRGELPLNALDQPRQARSVLILVGRGAREGGANRFEGLRGRAVVHDALAERNRARAPGG